MHSQPPRPLPVVHRRERSNGDGSEAHEGDAVPLMVYASRIGTRDPDALNITRGSGAREGLVWAPSWEILRPALDARRHVEALREVADGDSEVAGLAADEAAMAWAEAWEAYVPAYIAEMRQNYRRHRAAWDALLAKPRVVLACYCTSQTECHRYLLGAHILPRLGAVWCGELGGAKTNAPPPK